jgi:hypothetical protein
MLVRLSYQTKPRTTNSGVGSALEISRTPVQVATGIQVAEKRDRCFRSMFERSVARWQLRLSTSALVRSLYHNCTNKQMALTKNTAQPKPHNTTKSLLTCLIENVYGSLEY